MIAVVVTTKGNHGVSSCSIHRQGLGHTGFIALFIADHKSDRVCTVGQINIGQSHAATRRFKASISGHIYAIDIDLGGGIVQTCCVACHGVSDRRAEGEIVVGNGLTVQSHKAINISGHGGIGDDGSVSVINNVTVIKRDVVDIQNKLFHRIVILRGAVDELEQRREIISVCFLAIVHSIVLIGIILRRRLEIIRRQIVINIDPTRFGNSVVGIVTDIFPVKIGHHIVVVCIKLARAVLGKGAADTKCSISGVLRHIHPHTYANRTLSVSYITPDLCFTRIVQVIVDPIADALCVQTVKLKPKRILTRLDTTSVLFCSKKNTCTYIFNTVAVIFRIENGIFRIGVLFIFSSDPFADRIGSAPVADISVLEIEENFGSLAKLNTYRGRTYRRIMLIGCSDHSTSDRFIISSGEIKATQGTCRGILYRPIKIGGDRVGFVVVIHSNNLHGSGLTVRNGLLLCTEGNAFRMNDTNRLGANHLTVIHHLYIYIAHFTVRGKGSVFNGTKAVVGQCPYHRFWNAVGGSIGCINANSGEGIACIGKEIIVITGNDRMVKGSVCHSSRYDHQGVGYGTLCLTRGGIHRLKFVRTLADGTERSRVTAIQVKGLYTTQLQHHLGLLVNGKTNGLRSLATVSGHGDDLTVSGNTDGLAGILGSPIQASTNLAVLNQMNITANSFLDLPLVLGIITLGADHDGTVLQYSKEAISVTIGRYINTFHNECAGGSTVSNVIIRCIQACNHFERLFIISLHSSYLLRKRLHTPFCTLVVLVISVELNSGNRRVRRGDIHFNTFAVTIVHNNLVHSNAGRQC